jgi:hypothetical protein
MAKAIKILKLKPTQLALGMVEVEEKVKEYKKLSAKKLEKTIKEDPVDVVVAPNHWHYLIDGHHRICAQWLVGQKKTYYKVVKDFSKKRMSYKRFWKEMKAHKWTHLYDQYGEGPQDQLYLPEDIKGLADDPYRSLTYLVEQEGGFKKPKKQYADFGWANFFRKEKLLQCDFKKHFDKATKKAVKLARSPKARHLPGYIEKSAG